MNKQVDGLSPLTSPVGDDLVPVFDTNEVGTEKLKKVRIQNLFWKYDSQIATTSGTSITLTTSIPSGCLAVEVMLNGVSTSTNGQPPIIRLGDAGGVETTGYVGVVRGPTGEGAVTDGFYTFRTNAWSSGDILSGRLRLTRWDINEHLWFADCLCQDQANISSFSGRKTTSQVMTSIFLTTPGGTATFDLGEARVRYML